MAVKELDYSILEKLNFEYTPVGVKFSMDKPEGIEPLEGDHALCELIRTAHQGKASYVSRVQCGGQVLGQTEYPPVM
ncbi:MAG: DUF169 domain-containing protein, partial [Dehalococcoidales bacterium]|nr:DUF169 domain-containing protein [Dehalococcoidales bacterium]